MYHLRKERRPRRQCQDFRLREKIQLLRSSSSPGEGLRRRPLSRPPAPFHHHYHQLGSPQNRRKTSEEPEEGVDRESRNAGRSLGERVELRRREDLRNEAPADWLKMTWKDFDLSPTA